MMARRRLSTVLTLWLSFGLAFDAHAVAYCALRDPVKTIYELFPEADNYRSNVGTVDRDARKEILEVLSVPLHFNELGRHSLYVAQRGETPLGFVHARSETGEWGLIEFAWAISTAQTIVGVKVQRARDPALLRPGAIQTLAASLIGRDLVDLKRLIAEPVTPADSVFGSLLNSAAKTLAITAAVWPDEVQQGWQNNTPGLLMPHFEVYPIKDLIDARMQQALTNAGLQRSPAFKRSQLKGFKLRNSADNRNIFALLSEIDSVEPNLTLWWILNADGEVLAVKHAGGPPIPPAIASTPGLVPKDAKNCSGLAELAALEAALLARYHLRI